MRDFPYIIYMKTKRLWKRVKAQIKSHKITLKKFAEYINVPRSTLYGWIRLNLAPDVFTAFDIATALGVSLEYLVTGEDKKSEKLRMEQTESRKTTEAEVRKLVGKLQDEVVKF